MLLILLLAAAVQAGDPPAAPAVPASSAAIEEAGLRELLTIRRVFVDRLSGVETAAQMRDMIMSSLQNSRLFVITENQERADAILRGSAEDLVFTDTHSSSDSINAHANFGNSRSTRERGQYAGVTAGENESERSTERRHEAVAAVRLVNKEGDVIWSTTQESLGGKFRGASADVADKITRRLAEDYQKAKKLKP
ncbi:MAG TPA: hypothetical protein VG672_27495 [Bryobacteraceae bacterium]|nr:hypothetical protein [Bryobacteraceae bacterium]